MRTTVTLDPDTEALIRQVMLERGVTFKQALNDAIRAGAGERPAFRTTTRAMGPARTDLDRALRLAGDLEDDELVRRMQVGK